MKQNILLVFALISFTALSAQNLEFSPSPVIVQDVAAADFEGVGYALITSDVAEDRNLSWELVIVDKAAEWDVAVCDKNLCYDPLTTTQSFVLNPGEEGRMDVHAYPNNRDGFAIVELVVTDDDNADLSVSNLYYFNSDPSSTTDVTRQQVKVYPNPSTGLFSVKAGKQLATVQVFSLTGQQVKSFTYNDGQWYDITDLPKGTYLVRLIDRDAQQLVTKLMHKL